MSTETIKNRLRRWLGTAVYCPHCAARLDLGLGLLAVASPSRLQAEHMPVCSNSAARDLFHLGRGLAKLAPSEQQRQALAEAMRKVGAEVIKMQAAFAEAARVLDEQRDRGPSAHG